MLSVIAFLQQNLSSCPPIIKLLYYTTMVRPTYPTLYSLYSMHGNPCFYISACICMHAYDTSIYFSRPAHALALGHACMLHGMYGQKLQLQGCMTQFCTNCRCFQQLAPQYREPAPNCYMGLFYFIGLKGPAFCTFPRNQLNWYLQNTIEFENIFI